MTDVQCERTSCGQFGHNAATCPDSVRRNCRIKGHNANECSQRLLCSCCGNSGHFSFQCETKRIVDFLCRIC
ncbi:hypothetical protein HDV62DRAFT_353696 [Trichoderma sp. SZMC 28011]